MRFLPALLASLAFAAPAICEPLSKDALRDLVATGDTTAVNAALDGLEADVANGTVSYDWQRHVYDAFDVTHPDMDAFIDDWLADGSGSGHAHLARAIYDKNIAWIVRGEGLAARTHPAATETFHRMRRVAVSHAIQAYELMPRHVVAADVMIAFAVTGEAPERAETYLERIMTARPNHGSLRAALFATNPGWGGSWRMARRMCDRWVRKVADREAYTRGVCLVEAAFGASHSTRTHGQELARILRTDRSPMLDRWRLHDALYVRHGELSVAQEAAEIAMSLDTYRDLDTAQRFDTHYSYKLGGQSVLRAVLERLRPWAEAEIVHDPYDPYLIEILTATHDGAGQPLSYRPPRPDQIALYHQLLELKRFDPEIWAKLAMMVLNESRTDESFLDDPFASYPYRVNAAAYGRNSHERAMYVARLFYEILMTLEAVETRTSIPDELRQKYRDSAIGRLRDDELICPLVRAHRIAMETCRISEESEIGCADSVQAQGMMVFIADAERRGMCKHERKAPLDELFYTPLPLDARPSQSRGL